MTPASLPLLAPRPTLGRGARSVLAALALLATCALAARGRMAAAQGEAAVGPAPTLVSVGVGEQVVVAIQVRDIADLNAVDIRLGFDPTILQVVDVDPAKDGVQVELLEQFLKPDFVLANAADNDDGGVWFAATQLQPSAPASGSGDLARITLRGLKAGASGLVVVEQLLVRPSGDPIAVATFDALVTVGDGGPTRTPPPPATARPSATPSPPATEPTRPTEPTPDASRTAEPTATPGADTFVIDLPFASVKR